MNDMLKDLIVALLDEINHSYMDNVELTKRIEAINKVAFNQGFNQGYISALDNYVPAPDRKENL